MVLWFARGVRRGVVTTRYPFTAPDPWTADLPTPPAFRAAAMTEPVADALVAVCPSGALRRADDQLVYDVGGCTACQRCLAAVPGAGHPSGAFELAATARDHLIRRIPVRPSRGGPS